MSASVEYVYCVLPTAVGVHDAPRGLDRAGVRCVAAGGLAAVTSTLSASDYSGDVVSERTGDPEWLTPRAVAHDAVVTWAADRGAVIPFPMWVMFSDERAVLAMLAERAPDLDDTLRRTGGAKEFGVRVSGDQAALAAAAEAADLTLAELEEQAALAPPGQAYLLRRKLAEARKAATRDAALRIATQTHERLSHESRASLARTVATSNDPGVLLDGLYLVADNAYGSFRSVLTEMMAAYQPSGLRIDFTGPWPPYHFVRDD